MSMLTSPAKVQESHALCNPRSPKVSKKLVLWNYFDLFSVDQNLLAQSKKASIILPNFFFFSCNWLYHQRERTVFAAFKHRSITFFARIKTSLACTFRALSSFPLHSLNGRRRKEDLKVLLEEQRWPQFNKDSFVCTYTIIFTCCWRKTR